MSAETETGCGCCCGAGTIESERYEDERRFSDGTVATPPGPVTSVRTALSPRDRAGFWKVRLGISRMGYKVRPGLYAYGAPAADSPVFVTANYKASFDRLREGLAGAPGWILVLDTRGINVWCAAGKGTFGTDELVARIAAVGLDRVVSHRTLVLPQLGAPGVAAHEVRSRSGFEVVYGPVLARDLPAFLAAGMAAAPEMRRVRFPMGARLALSPMEVLPGLKWGVPTALALAVLGWLKVVPFPGRLLAGFAGAYLAGTVLAPALLPWLPGRPFAVKGAVAGGAWALVHSFASGLFASGPAGWLAAGAETLIFAAAAGILAMLFTGSSTFTSMSGVRREMAGAVPPLAAAALLGIALQAAVWLGLGR